MKPVEKYFLACLAAGLEQAKDRDPRYPAASQYFAMADKVHESVVQWPVGTDIASSLFTVIHSQLNSGRTETTCNEFEKILNATYDLARMVQGDWGRLSADNPRPENIHKAHALVKAYGVALA